MEPKVFTLDHIHYKTQDFEEIKRFYVDVMGATDLGSLKLGGEEHLQLRLAGMDLLFAKDANERSTEAMCDCKPESKPKFPCVVPPWTMRHGVYHIAILVDDCVEATKYFQKKADIVYKNKKMYYPKADGTNIVAKGPLVAADNIVASFLYAPDGMAIELKQNTAYLK